jgi:hypothetical protein
VLKDRHHALSLSLVNSKKLIDNSDGDIMVGAALIGDLDVVSALLE